MKNGLNKFQKGPNKSLVHVHVVGLIMMLEQKC